MAMILLVDDEPEIVEIMEIILGMNGHEVIVARDGQECFEVLQKELPDLILMDVMMPGMNGWDVCKKIKEDEKTRDIPVAMFTVRGSEDSEKKSLQYSKADDHISKPFGLEELLAKIEKLLDVSR